MKTNKFTGYCSLYNVNYYNTFMIMPHAFDSSDAKRVPVLKDYDFCNPNSIIGYAILSTKNDVGATAICFLNEDIEINNIVLDGHITDVLYGEDLNVMPKQVVSGNIRAIILNRKHACPYHECVKAVKDKEENK